MEEQCISHQVLAMLIGIGFNKSYFKNEFPTLSFVQKWLREKEIIVSVGTNFDFEWEFDELKGRCALSIEYYDYEIAFCDKVMREENCYHDYETHFTTYESALEAGIKKVCQLLNQNN